MTKFKDASGNWITQSLFLEYQYKEIYAVYTLSEEDKEYKGTLYPSIKKLYLDICDPTEYEFAQKCFGGWEHWKRLQKNKYLRPYINKWREELEIKLVSQGVRTLIEKSNEGGISIAKWLADKGWQPRRKAGAPSKEERKVFEDEVAKEVLETNADWKRISGPQ